MDAPLLAFPFVKKQVDFHLTQLCDQHDRQDGYCGFANLSAHLLCYALIAMRLPEFLTRLKLFEEAVAILESEVLDDKLATTSSSRGVQKAAGELSEVLKSQAIFLDQTRPIERSAAH